MALVSCEPRIDTAEAARRLGVSRDTLDRMTWEAPPNLPGAPVNVSAPDARKRRLLWDPGDLNTWFKAYGAWRSTRGTVTPVRAARPKAAPRQPAAGQPGQGKITMAELRARQKAG